MIRINQSPNFGTGPILVPNGSEGAPTYSFLSDPDTGFYSVGINSIGLSVGGTRRFYCETGLFSFFPDSAGEVRLSNSIILSFSSSGGAGDVGLYRNAAEI